jgi:hypothetical protein
MQAADEREGRTASILPVSCSQKHTAKPHTNTVAPVLLRGENGTGSGPPAAQNNQGRRKGQNLDRALDTPNDHKGLQGAPVLSELRELDLSCMLPTSKQASVAPAALALLGRFTSLVYLRLDGRALDPRAVETMCTSLHQLVSISVDKCFASACVPTAIVAYVGIVVLS